MIDANSNTVIATIALEGKPEVAVTDGKGKVYVNLEDKNKVAAIDVKTKKVIDSWSIAPGESPSGLAIDLEKQRLFMVCENKLMVVFDLKAHKVIATLPIGDRVDGVAFDPIFKRAFASNGQGTLTIVQEEEKQNYSVKQNLVTQKGAKTIALNSKTHHVFLSTADFGATPTPTTEKPKPRPDIIPDTFVILDVAPAN